MNTYAKPRYIKGTDSVPAIRLKTAEHINLGFHEWARCEQPDILDDEEFNLIIHHPDNTFYRVKSLDYEFANADDVQVKHRSLINGFLFNGCTNCEMPDWSSYSQLELHPVNSNSAPDGSTECAIITDFHDEGQADFWSIYGRLDNPEEPLSEIVTDITDKREAIGTAKRLAEKYELVLYAPLVDLNDDTYADNVSVFDVQIQATITKTISVIAESDDDLSASHKANEYFRAASDNTPEIYNQETVSVKEVCNVL